MFTTQSKRSEHWATLPFEVNGTNVGICLQENLIELPSDEIFQVIFKDGKHNVWKSNDKKKYPLLWEKANLYVSAFSLSFLVKPGFNRI